MLGKAQSYPKKDKYWKLTISLSYLHYVSTFMQAEPISEDKKALRPSRALASVSPLTAPFQLLLKLPFLYSHILSSSP